MAESNHPSGGYYTIDSEEQLAGLAKWVNEGIGSADKHYILKKNLDLGYEPWTPIGSGDVDRGVLITNTAKGFEGVFDGQGHTISRLRASSGNIVGLFGLISGDEGVEVKNLTLIEPKVSGNRYVGGLAGYVIGIKNATGPRISTVGVEGGTVSATGHTVGGLVGRSYLNARIASSYVTCAVRGSSTLVGGLVGDCSLGIHITSSYATGAVSGSGDYVGGLVGHDSLSTIASSYAMGAISGLGDYVGGLVGGNGGGSTITSSYATGAVIGSGNRVGGLAGSNFLNSTITSSYATGAVSGSGNHVGGLAGFNDDSQNAKITASAYDPQGTGQAGAVSGDRHDAVATTFTRSGDWLSASRWGEPSWDVSTTGIYYPQIASFDNHLSPDVRAWSALSVVPVILSGDESGGELSSAVTSWFRIPERDADKSPLTWIISPDSAPYVSFYKPNSDNSDENTYYYVGLNQVAASADVWLTASNDLAGPKAFRLRVSCDLAPSVAVPPDASIHNKLSIVGTDERTPTPPPVTPGGGDDGGSEPSLPAHYKSADIRAISLTVGGTTSKGTLQPNGSTWVILMPYGTDLSSVTPDISIYPGATYTPPPPYNLSQPQTIIVTALDGKSTMEYTVEVRVGLPPEVAAKILDALPANASAHLARNADGSWTLELLIPFDAAFDPAETESIILEVEGISGIRVRYVNADGGEKEFSRSAAGDRLRITGTVASRADVARARIVKIIVKKKNDATTYYQNLNMSLSAIPGGQLPPEEPEDTGSGGGCDVGALASLALLAIGVAIKRRR